MANREKGNIHLLFQENRLDGTPIVFLRNSRRVREDMREELQKTSEEKVIFGLELPIFNQTLLSMDLPISGIKLRDIKTGIYSYGDDRNNLKITGKITPHFINKGLSFSVVLTSEQGKLEIVEKSFGLSFVDLAQQQQIDTAFKNIDDFAKNVLNKELKNAGNVEGFQIGMTLLECTVRKNKNLQVTSKH